MRAILLSTLALGALTTTAIAAEPVMSPSATSGPVVLTDAEMDSVVAGEPNNGWGIDSAHDKIDHDKSVITSPDGAPYSTGNIGYSAADDGRPRGTGNVYPGWGKYERDN